MKKTNALRLLEKAGIPYTPHEYATDDGALDGLSVALKTGRDPARVFKTLVLQGAPKSLYVFCLPVSAELSLKTAAAAAGEKSLSLLPLAALLPATGYKRGGCSPIGMKKAYPTFLEKSAFSQTSLLVSGGRVGLQVELSPENLVKATGAACFSL